MDSCSLSILCQTRVANILLGKQLPTLILPFLTFFTTPTQLKAIMIETDVILRHSGCFLNHKESSVILLSSVSPPLVGEACRLSTPAAWGHVSLLAPWKRQESVI